jgi:hypothetical protein
LTIRRATDAAQSYPQLLYDDVSNSVRGISNQTDFFFVPHNGVSAMQPICSPFGFVRPPTTSSRSSSMPIFTFTVTGRPGGETTLPEDFSQDTPTTTGVKGGTSSSTLFASGGAKIENTVRDGRSSTTAPGSDAAMQDIAVFVVPAVAAVVLASSILIICVAMRRNRRAASAVVVLLSLLTGGVVAQPTWSRVPIDSRAIVESDVVVHAYLLVPVGWSVNLFVNNVYNVDVDDRSLVASCEPPLPTPPAGGTRAPTGGTSTVVATLVTGLVDTASDSSAGVEPPPVGVGETAPIDTNSFGGALSADANAMAMGAQSPELDLTAIVVYSISGVCMLLSALFAIGVWVWMRRPAEEQAVRLDTPMTATPPLTSAKSAASAVTFKDALSVRAETEYSKAPSPREHQLLGYDAVPPQEYVAAPAATDLAPASDSAGYTRAPARYESVGTTGGGSASMPTSNSSSSHYTRPGVDRRAFASGEIDFATPDEEEASAPVAAPPAMRTVSWSSIVLGERIGAGSYGEVFNATLDGEVVAVKKLLDESGTREFERETKLMSVLPPHRNVLRVYAAAYDPPAIVSELCELGSLDQHQRLTQRKLLVVARDIADGMAHLHAHSIVHRDLAARNLLVNSKRVVKVADFGLARITNEDTYASTVDASAGPAKWMAPETIEKGKFSPAGDVWSFGVVLWELATGKRPFADMTAAAAAVAIAKGERLPRPADISDELWTLMQSCWHTDPHKRPSMAQIVAQLAQMLTNVARHA